MNSQTLATDWVLVESAGNGESKEDFLVLSGRGASDLEVRRISGAAALLQALRNLAPRRLILEFQGSFRRSLDLLRTLKVAVPELKLVACVRSPRSKEAEPLYFSVDVQTSKVSLHRMSPEGFADGVIAPRGEVAV